MSETAHLEEEALGKAYDARLMRRLIGFLGAHRGKVAVATLLVLTAAGLEIVQPWLWKIAIDSFIARGDFAGLTRVAVVYLCVLAIEFGVNYFQTRIMQDVGQQIMYTLRHDLFAKLQRMSLAFYDRNPVGRLMTRLTGDVDVLNELFTSGVVTIVGDVVTLLGIMVAIFLMNAELALVAFSVLPLIFLVTLVFRSRVRETYRDVRTALARMNANLQENITGMTTTHVMNREARQFEGFRQTNADHRDANVRSIFYYAVFFPAVEFIGALAAALIVWYGGRQVLGGHLTVGALVAFFQYSQRFFRPISDMTEKYNILQSAMASSERIFNLLDEEVEVAPPAQPRSVAPVRGAIEFDHVHFAYQSGEEVLKRRELRRRARREGRHRGRHGRGQDDDHLALDALLRRAAGRHPRGRRRRARVGRGRARRAIGVVLQDVFLFSGTIEENLRLGDAIPRERLVAAAREVHADRFIERLPAATTPR